MSVRSRRQYVAAFPPSASASFSFECAQHKLPSASNKALPLSSYEIAAPHEPQKPDVAREYNRMNEESLLQLGLTDVASRSAYRAVALMPPASNQNEFDVGATVESEGPMNLETFAAFYQQYMTQQQQLLQQQQLMQESQQSNETLSNTTASGAASPVPQPAVVTTSNGYTVPSPAIQANPYSVFNFATGTSSPISPSSPRNIRSIISSPVAPPRSDIQAVPPGQSHTFLWPAQQQHREMQAQQLQQLRAAVAQDAVNTQAPEDSSAAESSNTLVQHHQRNPSNRVSLTNAPTVLISPIQQPATITVSSSPSENRHRPATIGTYQLSQYVDANNVESPLYEHEVEEQIDEQQHTQNKKPSQQMQSPHRPSSAVRMQPSPPPTRHIPRPYTARPHQFDGRSTLSRPQSSRSRVSSRPISASTLLAPPPSQAHAHIQAMLVAHAHIRAELGAKSGYNSARGSHGTSLAASRTSSRPQSSLKASRPQSGSIHMTKATSSAPQTPNPSMDRDVIRSLIDARVSKELETALSSEARIGQRSQQQSFEWNNWLALKKEAMNIYRRQQAYQVRMSEKERREQMQKAGLDPNSQLLSKDGNSSKAETSDGSITGRSNNVADAIPDSILRSLAERDLIERCDAHFREVNQELQQHQAVYQSVDEHIDAILPASAGSSPIVTNRTVAAYSATTNSGASTNPASPRLSRRTRSADPNSSTTNATATSASGNDSEPRSASHTRSESTPPPHLVVHSVDIGLPPTAPRARSASRPSPAPSPNGTTVRSSATAGSSPARTARAVSLSVSIPPNERNILSPKAVGVQPSPSSNAHTLDALAVGASPLNASPFLQTPSQRQQQQQQQNQKGGVGARLPRPHSAHPVSSPRVSALPPHHPSRQPSSASHQVPSLGAHVGESILLHNPNGLSISVSRSRSPSESRNASPITSPPTLSACASGSIVQTVGTFLSEDNPATYLLQQEPNWFGYNYAYGGQVEETNYDSNANGMTKASSIKKRSQSAARSRSTGRSRPASSSSARTSVGAVNTPGRGAADLQTMEPMVEAALKVLSHPSAASAMYASKELEHTKIARQQQIEREFRNRPRSSITNHAMKLAIHRKQAQVALTTGEEETNLSYLTELAQAVQAKHLGEDIPAADQVGGSSGTVFEFQKHRIVPFVGPKTAGGAATAVRPLAHQQHKRSASFEKPSSPSKTGVTVMTGTTNAPTKPLSPVSAAHGFRSPQLPSSPLHARPPPQTLFSPTSGAPRKDNEPPIPRKAAVPRAFQLAVFEFERQKSIRQSRRARAEREKQLADAQLQPTATTLLYGKPGSATTSSSGGGLGAVVNQATRVNALPVSPNEEKESTALETLGVPAHVLQGEKVKAGPRVFHSDIRAMEKSARDPTLALKHNEAFEPTRRISAAGGVGKQTIKPWHESPVTLQVAQRTNERIINHDSLTAAHERSFVEAVFHKIPRGVTKADVVAERHRKSVLISPTASSVQKRRHMSGDMSELPLRTRGRPSQLILPEFEPADVDVTEERKAEDVTMTSNSATKVNMILLSPPLTNTRILKQLNAPTK